MTNRYRVVLVGVVVCWIPAALRLWAVVESERLARAGLGDDALMAICSDPLTRLVGEGLSLVGVNASLFVLNIACVVGWLAIGAVLSAVVVRVGRRGIRLTDA